MARRGGLMIRAKRLARGSAVAGIVAAFGVGVGVGRIGRERSTVSRLSPDETIRARLVETSDPADPLRTFSIRLERPGGGPDTVIFRSPDAGKPEGTERLVWSRDGSYLLLVGRHFFVRENMFLDNGDQVYFLHHVPSGRSWLNSAGPGGPPMLAAGQVQGVEFTEPMVLKGPELGGPWRWPPAGVIIGGDGRTPRPPSPSDGPP